MHAILTAVLLAAAAQADTAYTADGGRVRGSVIEESPQGVTIQLLDGSTRRYAAREVVRIEYGDGSVSTPRPPAPPPAAAPAPQVAAPQVVQAAQQPTVIMVPCPACPTCPPPAPTAPPPAPVQAAPVHRVPAGDPPAPFYLSLGLGGLSMSGNLEKGVPTDTLFRDQAQVMAEIGFRPSPSTGFGLYLDIGAGEPSQALNASSECAAANGGCMASTGRIGILLRHTFDPAAPRTGWVAMGMGAAFGNVSVQDQQGMPDLYTYTGWEALRLMLGYDLRTSSTLGFGVYGGVGWSKFTKVEGPTGTQVAIADQAFHTTVEAGVRIILFP